MPCLRGCQEWQSLARKSSSQTSVMCSVYWSQVTCRFGDNPMSHVCPGDFAAAVRARERRGRGSAGGRVPAAAPAPAGLPRARRCLRACAGRPPRARTSALLNIIHGHEYDRLNFCLIVPRRLRAAAMQVRTSASHASRKGAQMRWGAALCPRWPAHFGCTYVLCYANSVDTRLPGPHSAAVSGRGSAARFRCAAQGALQQYQVCSNSRLERQCRWTGLRRAHCNCIKHAAIVDWKGGAGDGAAQGAPGGGGRVVVPRDPGGGAGAAGGRLPGPGDAHAVRLLAGAPASSAVLCLRT